MRDGLCCISSTRMCSERLPAFIPRCLQVIVIAIFAGYFIMTGIGIPRLQEGQPLSELAPDDSYLQDYNTIMTNTVRQRAKPYGAAPQLLRVPRPGRRRR